MKQISFWKPRYWVWIGILVFFWLAFNGPADIPTFRGTPVAQVGGYVGYFGALLIVMVCWIIAIEIPYRLIGWLVSKLRNNP